MNNIILDERIAKEIQENNIRQEKMSLSQSACPSSKAIRLKEEEIFIEKAGIRPAFFHDTDRIIHSFAYTRYIDKTQVFYLFKNDHITHRVLHVQLVSKIARVIGRSLSLNEDLIDAISLGHDLGHVPYGHFGEDKLSQLLHQETGEYFCHNAQSVRSLQLLENKGLGLNLTLQTLDGILCHNGELMLKEYKPNYKKTKTDFQRELKSCWTTKDASKSIIAMTLEGCVMRISDVIAYIGRDLEDAITLGLISRDSIPTDITDIIGNTNASIVNNFVNDIINNSYGKNYIKLSKTMYNAINAFYRFSKTNIYYNPKKTSQDPKIEHMFEILFALYLKDLESGKGETGISQHFMNNMSEEYITTTSNPRKVCDYIAGMTDAFFNKEFKDIMLPHSFGYKI